MHMWRFVSSRFRFTPPVWEIWSQLPQRDTSASAHWDQHFIGITLQAVSHNQCNCPGKKEKDIFLWISWLTHSTAIYMYSLSWQVTLISAVPSQDHKSWCAHWHRLYYLGIYYLVLLLLFHSCWKLSRINLIMLSLTTRCTDSMSKIA